MTNNIRQLRELLQITQSDLAFLLRRSRAMINHYEKGRKFETGEPGEQLFELERLTRLSKNGSTANPWVDDARLKEKAIRWEKRERERSTEKVASIEYRLQDMEERYQKSLRALGICARIQSHTDCPADIRQWIGIVAHSIARVAERNSPMHQARLRIVRDQLKGKIIKD